MKLLLFNKLQFLDKIKQRLLYRKKNKQIKQQQVILSIPYPMKTHYNMVIPANIFQTWHSKNLPPLMRAATIYLQKVNPNFKYYLYDDNDCYTFIQDNFDSEVLHAYESLIPGAFKADLWRYCILYKYGGVYLDIKYIPMKSFKMIALTEKEHFCLDIDNNGIYNAIMVCKAGNPILKKAIQQIVDNVHTKFYGSDRLEPTGPGLLSRYFSGNEKRRIDMKHVFHGSIEYRYILFNNYYVFQSYSGYLQEHDKYKKVDYYGNLWNQRNIYK